MNYNTHKLNSQSHSHIIDRQDSVTSDTIKANDEVVFCSACQSVFLKESWKYMNETHCNQTETLDFIPAQEKEIKIKKKDVLIFEVPAITKKEYKNKLGLYYFILSIYPLFFIIISVLMIVNNIKMQDMLSPLVKLTLLIILASYLFIRIIHNIRKAYNNGLSSFQMYEDRISIFSKVYDWKEVEYIVYDMQKVLFSKKRTNRIRICVNGEEKYFNLLPQIIYPDNKAFLFNLLQLSTLTKVIFYTEDEKEYQFLEDKKEEHTGNIILTKKMPFS